ncbi:putative ribonuclease H-like domain-containing protein [Tanacetum coccineum]
MLHMDLFGPTFIRSIMKKMYCLVVTDDYSRFSWVFFLATKDETSGILKDFIIGIENQINHRVKIIRCDNGTKFKNKEMNQFCKMKGIKREFSVARTPQQNGVAERKNRTLIEVARTMLANSKLPTNFWAEAVNTACYVQNRPVTILNTLDHLGKFDGKADEGFFVGYSMNSKAFKVFNKDNVVDENIVYGCANDLNMPNLEEINYLNDDEGVGAEADMNNLDTFMLDELLQFKLQQVWTLVDLPYGKRAIETKWIYKNKKDERGIVVRNKEMLVAQVYTQKEGIDYDEVFAPVAKIEAIRLFLAYALFKDFVVYQMDVKSAFLYGKIEEEVYVCQPPGFEDPEFPDRVYKVEKALYCLHQAPRA